VVWQGFCTFPIIENQPGIPILAIARLTRVQTDKRDYNKIVDKCRFFEVNAQVFGVAATRRRSLHLN
jgi:hypothetical protein